MKYWLIKSEPSCYSMQDLRNDITQPWDGVRNYQARNFMRDEMEKGDIAFFYHSNCNPPHIAGVCKISKESYPDYTSWDDSPYAKHFDPKSSPENPRWFMVEVEFVEEFVHSIFLSDLRNNPKLASMQILQKGNRLSITPILPQEYKEIISMSKK